MGGKPYHRWSAPLSLPTGTATLAQSSCLFRKSVGIMSDFLNFCKRQWTDDSKISADTATAIDLQIEEDARRLRKECRVLLMGSVDSGKSTIAKQFIRSGLSQDERLEARPRIYQAVLDCVRGIVCEVERISLEWSQADNKLNAEKILAHRAALCSMLSEEIIHVIDDLWHDPVIHEFMEKCNDYCLLDTATHFLGDVLRIGSIGYVPSEADVLRLKTDTKYLEETRIGFGQLSILVIEVGGQRSSSRKWMHCFENVTSLAFCVALNEYNGVGIEDKNKNRLAQSMLLFESLVNSPWFSQASVLLFMNKVDIFKTMIAQIPLSDFFPEYTGGADFNKAVKYILWRFMLGNRARLSIYPRLMCAVSPDGDAVRLMFAAVKETILQKALRDSRCFRDVELL